MVRTQAGIPRRINLCVLFRIWLPVLLSASALGPEPARWVTRRPALPPKEYVRTKHSRNGGTVLLALVAKVGSFAPTQFEYVVGHGCELEKGWQMYLRGGAGGKPGSTAADLFGSMVPRAVQVQRLKQIALKKQQAKQQQQEIEQEQSHGQHEENSPITCAATDRRTRNPKVHAGLTDDMHSRILRELQVRVKCGDCCI